MNIVLLNRLREANGAPVPLAELGADAAIVQADLDALETFGFAFERHPYQGVAYRGPAVRLCPDQIEYELNTIRVGRRVAVWNRVPSTNDLAARASGSSSNQGLVILAEEQTAGRGRRGRTWAAPASTSLLMSVLLFPPPPLAETGWLTALGGVATAEVVSEWTGHEARIKWPNDVRVGGRKVAGILIERGLGAVIGIGLNVNLLLEDFPGDLRTRATSLQILSGHRFDRSELARALIRRLDDWYDRGLRGGPDSLNRPWRDRSEHLGRDVRVTTTSGDQVGRLENLDLRRGLVLQIPGQGVRHVATDEVQAISSVNPGTGADSETFASNDE